jgi:flavin reductase (DIM6/NTAB) family NADH-FMN oxidoreductase RutF
MHTYDRFATLIPSEREKRDNHRTLLSVVLPRPIAFVSTISAAGVPNLAPFSFFNAVGNSPPAIIFSPATRPDGTLKDTILNLREVPECVVHVVTYAIRDEMNLASIPFPHDVSEFDAAGFTPIPSRFVRPPRAAESPVQMECRLMQIVPVGEGPLSGNLCICEILCFHIAEEIVLPDGSADITRLDPVGRLGGDDYSTARDRFALPKPVFVRPAAPPASSPRQD